MNCRFTMAAHVLAMLAHAHREGRGPVTSGQMAASIQTNPVVVRRLIRELVRAGLVVSRRGAHGGETLARRPEDITLQEAYRAVEDGVEMFGRHPSGPNPDCPIGPPVAAYLAGVFGRAEAALEAALAEVTIADMVGAPLAQGGRRARRAR
ncbi:MAG TPA: Rrf2 family transcriptional regulator [Vicinamibacteria bacterium]|nr:Rrf2 family transcriptional regulator [Vicinamibacteria bacterium]